MPYTIEDYKKDELEFFKAEILPTLPVEERLKGLSPEEILKRFSPDKRLKGLSAKEIMEGLTPEEFEALMREARKKRIKKIIKD